MTNFDLNPLLLSFLSIVPLSHHPQDVCLFQSFYFGFTISESNTFSFFYWSHKAKYGLPWWLGGKESACQVRDMGLIPGLGRSPGEGNSKPFQYSCLDNPTDKGAWRATVHGVKNELDKT